MKLLHELLEMANIRSDRPYIVHFVTKDNAPEGVPHYESYRTRAANAKEAKQKGLRSIENKHKQYVSVHIKVVRK